MKSKKSLVATCHERLFLNFFGFRRKTVNLPFTPRKTASQRGFAAISGDFLRILRTVKCDFQERWCDTFFLCSF